jgi:phage-related protein
MDIAAKNWEVGKSYKVDDIVRAGNLSLPYYVNTKKPKDEDGYFDKAGANKIITDGEEKITTDVPDFLIMDQKVRGEIFDKKTFDDSGQIEFGYYFPINKKLDYKSRVRIKKKDSSSDTIDPYNTFLHKNQRGSINPYLSIGIGIGVKFLDSSQGEVKPKDYRKTMRLMASSEINHKEYYNAQLYINSEDIPDRAVAGVTFIFAYGVDQGAFMFRDIKTTTASEYFYCTQDHYSWVGSIPGANESKYWTQDFKWRPSYGSNASFASINEELKMGDGSDYVNSLAINSLPMQVDVLFDNRTDREAKAIMHFLQEKHYAYESIFAIDYKGDRLLSSDVGCFNFNYTHPYRKDLKFTCIDFTHNIKYRNNNSISAKLICRTESILRSVESNSGFNERLDAIVKIFIDKTTKFVKGKKIKLNTFSMQDEEVDEYGNVISPGLRKLGAVKYIEGFSYNEEGRPTFGKIEFIEPQDLDRLDCVYINPVNSQDSVYNLTKTNIHAAIDEKTFIFGPLPETGDPSDLGGFDYLLSDDESKLDSDDERQITINNPNENPNIEVKKFVRCPEDCMSNAPFFPEGVESITSKLIDPDTGEEMKRVVFLKNFRRLQLETEITRTTTTIEFTPLSSFTLEAEDDFELLVPAARGRKSIYISNPDRVAKFPWAKVRTFENRPSLTFTLSNTPANIKTAFLKFYQKEYKKEINQNMSRFTVVFDQRDDEEAAEILQFLESHLGHRKFNFTLPRPYIADSGSETTPARKRTSVFYCPGWSHEIVYKNNHKITATFIESTTSLNESLGDMKGPCASASAFNLLTNHELCTFSSVATATHQEGLNYIKKSNSYDINLSKKIVEMVFVVDANPSMLSQYLNVAGTSISKYNAIRDVILKLVTGYDEDKFPGTISYGGAYDTPSISKGIGMDGEHTPPWYASYNSDGTAYSSLLNQYYDPNPSRTKESIKTLEENGYFTDNLFRFNFDIRDFSINIGVLLIGDRSSLDKPLIGDKMVEIPDHPKSFDKIEIYKALTSYSPNNVYGKNVLNVTCDAMAQFFNSPKAGIVDERYVFMISDFKFNSTNNNGLLSIIQQSKPGGELAKRRPLDSVLKKYGSSGFTIHDRVDEYAGTESSWKTGFVDSFEVTYTNLYNPDFTDTYHPSEFSSSELPYVPGLQNKTWYQESIPTTFVPIGIGASKGVNTNFFKYSTDHQAYGKDYLSYDISNANPGSKEAQRTVRLVDAISAITKNSNSDKIFSVTIKNCGPNDIRLYNTIVSFEQSSGREKWRTELIEAGIPSGQDIRNIKEVDTASSRPEPTIGHGGQYYNDINNEKLLEDKKSNILWKTFNNKYEVYRKGQVHEINGGWKPDTIKYPIITDSGQNIILDSGAPLVTDPVVISPIKTEGIFNYGVAFKNYPVRVFGDKVGLNIIDYNITNISKENEYLGSYDHLPIIKRNETLDLFFGVRHKGPVENLNENVQLFFNTKDVEDGRMDCYADFSFNINMNKEGYEIEEPKIFLDRCRGRVLAIAMCNANAAKDDAFRIHLNDQPVADFRNLMYNQAKGDVLLFADDPDKDDAAKIYNILNTGLSCSPGNMRKHYAPYSSIRWGNPPNKIYLQNIGNVNNGNWGQLIFVSYKVGFPSTSDPGLNRTLAQPKILKTVTYSGRSGANFGPFYVRIDSCQ